MWHALIEHLECNEFKFRSAKEYSKFVNYVAMLTQQPWVKTGVGLASRVVRSQMDANWLPMARAEICGNNRHTNEKHSPSTCEVTADHNKWTSRSRKRLQLPSDKPSKPTARIPAENVLYLRRCPWVNPDLLGGVAETCRSVVGGCHRRGGVPKGVAQEN